jgi:hypothetical protein
VTSHLRPLHELKEEARSASSRGDYAKASEALYSA